MSETVTSPATPRVLTRNIIPALTQGLDAGDVLECYALVRSAPLHGIANSTLHIQKMALGVRYRPSAANAAQLGKEQLELTLEYGPQRVGPLLNHEATPFIQVEQSSSFIAWENVGKVYYTTKIVSENFLSSYYMASMTGAVLSKTLAHAVEYSERRRRYQPFAVYSEENGKELRSSSSSDFIQFMWQHLANLGVEIEPILPPPVYEARLWVDSLKKVRPEPAVADAAATFYKRLYKCIEAIATNDYGAFVPTASPTMSPAPSEKSSLSVMPSDQPSGDDNSTSHVESSNDWGSSAIANSTISPAGSSDAPVDGNVTDSSGGEAKQIPKDDRPKDKTSNNAGGEKFSGGGDDEGSSEGGKASGDGARRVRYENEDSAIDGEADDEADAGSEQPTNAPSTLGTQTPTQLENPEQATDTTPSSGQDVEKAQQAAQEAQAAADEAKNAAQTEGDTKAADAAQVAAHAAQAAADATSNAAWQAAMDGLLSGDGSVMTSILATCFSNPQYEIASIDENGTLTSEAYLYRDGSLYYKLSLTRPFLDVAKVNRPLPKAVTLSNYGSGGDFIDWVLALVVLGGVALMVLVILQQMGNKYIESIFRCQRWFFNPRKYDYEGDLIRDDDEGYSHNFGEDGIPLSMGGRRARVSPVQRSRTIRQASSFMGNEEELRWPELAHSRSKSPPSRQSERVDESSGDVELSRVPSRVGKRKTPRGDSSSFGNLSDDEIEDTVLPERLTRDPDLVEFPHLKSKSKVAVPAGTPSDIKLHRKSSSNISNGSVDHFD